MRRMRVKTLGVLSATVIAVACFLLSVRADDGAIRAHGRPFQTAVTEPDPGSVSGNVYTNEFFGMTYRFPQGWFVDKTETDQYNASTEKFRTSQTGNGNSTVRPSYTLLIVSRVSEGARCENCPVEHEHGPRITLSVGSLTDSGQAQTANDIQSTFKRRFDGKGKYRVVRGPTTCSYNGEMFSCMDATNGATYQGDAITIRKHYRIEFQMFADSPEQLEDLYKTLDTLQFKP